VDNDTDHNGYLNYFEFSRLVLYGLGQYLPVRSLQSFYGRYAHWRGINIDSFLLAIAKMDVAKRKPGI
jgi:hypothetical protein